MMISENTLRLILQLKEKNSIQQIRANHCNRIAQKIHPMVIEPSQSLHQ
jgi:hypothetical protein